MDNPNGRHILLVDDEPLVRRSLSEYLTHSGYVVATASNGREAIEHLNSHNADMVITDMKMPEVDGLGLLRHIKKIHPETPVILITSYGSIENAVSAMKEGAYDYITKPIVDSEIKIVIERLVNQKKLKEENERLRNLLSEQQKERFHQIIGKDDKMQKIYSLIEAISNTRATVLINGESGTGKRLVAHAVHKYNEKERGKPFVEVSCGALTETLLESELFGHVKGAFTGAIKDKAGRFELADGGSIFLDEIDAFTPALQVKLLRVLQDGEYERVGESNTVKIDVRVIAATNQNLENLIVQGKFRKDLYYRLNIISIELPPLRDRKGDIPLLIEEFVKKHTVHIKKKVSGLSKESQELLGAYDWPGNIRELENVIERAMILTKGPLIIPEDLPDCVKNRHKHFSREDINESAFSNLKDALKNPERDLITKALESVSWNRNKAAEVLGINRTTLYKKMQKFGLLRIQKFMLANNNPREESFLLKELLVQKDWQLIQDSFSAVTEVSLRTLDAEGKLFSAVSREPRLCKEFFKNSTFKEKICGDCLPTFLGGRATVDSNLSFSCYGGMHSFIAPLRVNGGSALGYIVLGPMVLVMRKPKKTYQGIAEELGMDFEDFWNAFLEIRVISFNAIRSFVDLMQDIAEYIIRLKYHNYVKIKEVSIPGSRRLDGLLEALLDVAFQVTGADIGSVMFLDGDTDNLTIRSSKGIPEEVVKDTRMRLGEGIAGLAVQEKRTFLLNAKQEAPDNRISLYLNRPYLGSSMVVPIEVDKRGVGVVNLSSLKSSQVRFNEANVRIIEKLINLATLAIAPAG